MARPLPFMQFSKVHPEAGAVVTLTTIEEVIGRAEISPSGKPVAVTLAVKVLAQFSAVTGTATVRMRTGSISGPIIATATATSAGVVVTGTGTLAAPSVPTIIVVTGQNSTSTSTIAMFDVVATGDGTDPAFDTLTGSAYTELSPWVGGLMLRDDNDRVWLLDRDQETAYSRRQLTRVFPQIHGAGHVGAKQLKPWVVLVGTDLWVFSANSRTPSLVSTVYDANAYELTVLDGLDLTIKFTSINTSTSTLHNIAAVYDGTQFVWVFFVTGGTTITVHKWDRHNIGAGGTSTTYRTVAGAVFTALDATLLPHGEIAVVATSLSGHTITIDHSYLDPATGASRASPAAVSTVVTAIDPSALCSGGVSIFDNQADSATSWRFACWQSDPADAANVLLVLRTVTASTLAVASTSTLATFNPAAIGNSVNVGQVCGARDDDGTVYWWGQCKADRSLTQVASAAHVMSLLSGTVGGSSVTTLARWLASKPFQDPDGTWYVLTGYDDGEDVNAQRALHVAEALQSNVIAQIAYSEAGPAFNYSRSDSVTGLGLAITVTNANVAFVTPVVQVPGGLLAAGMVVSGETSEGNQSRVLTLDFDATYSPAAVVSGGVLLYPGGIPQIAGPRDDLHDLGPLRGPNVTPTAVLGGGALLGTFFVTYLYRYQDASGATYTGPPSPQGSFAFTDDTANTSLTVQNLTHIGRGSAFIEIYASTATDPTPRLQHVIPNDPTALTQTVKVQPARWSGTTQAVYTQGGELIHFPPPPCRCVASWKNRVFLSGTTVDGEAWFSQESEVGVGVRLNPILRTTWEGDGAVFGIGVVDWNYLAFLRRDGIAAISGAGPDGNGAGNYVVASLNTRRGTERPFSIVSGPGGCYFQSASDGVIYLVTPGLQVVDVSAGIAGALDGAVVTAAAHMVTASEVWFFLLDGAAVSVAVLDYKWATQGQPAGQWYSWESAGLASACVGALEEGDGSITWLQADKGLRRIQAAFTDADDDGNEDPILMKLATGKMALPDLQSEVFVDTIKFLGQHVGESTLKIAVTPDSGSAEDHSVTTAAPTDYEVRPGNCLRVQEVEISVEETASTTEGFVYDGLAVEYIAPGRTKRGNNGKVI